MRYLFGLFSVFLICQLTHAQFTQEGKGEYSGQNITQADLDILFVNDPDLFWLNFSYTDTLLILPNFKKLDIFSLRSEVLQTIVLPDTLLALGLIDLNTPQLKNLNEAITPNLFDLTLFANLPSIPMFVCNSEGLTLVDIKNYRLIEWPECLDERFENGNFESSSCEIIDGFGGETMAKIVSPDNTSDEWLDNSDDMSDEELQEQLKGMQRTGRMITV
ncbi:MAG: hypothetical protein ACKOWX_01930, partial [Flavobacteriales bacterium]